MQQGWFHDPKPGGEIASRRALLLRGRLRKHSKGIRRHPQQASASLEMHCGWGERFFKEFRALEMYFGWGNVFNERQLLMHLR